MKHSPCRILMLGLGLTAGLLAVKGAYAGDTAHKVAICHGTASAKNPYVMIIVDESALNGHLDGTMPGHGKNNSPDFVLGRVNSKKEADAFRKAGDAACDAGPGGPGS